MRCIRQSDSPNQSRGCIVISARVVNFRLGRLQSRSISPLATDSLQILSAFVLVFVTDFGASYCTRQLACRAVWLTFAQVGTYSKPEILENVGLAKMSTRVTVWRSSNLLPGYASLGDMVVDGVEPPHCLYAVKADAEALTPPQVRLQ